MANHTQDMSLAAPTATIRPWIHYLFVGLIVAICLMHIWKYLIWKPADAWGVDYPKHHVAAVRILAGENPFVGENYLGFNYPIFTALLHSWLAAFSVEEGEHVWDAVGGALIMLSALIAALCYRPEPPPEPPEPQHPGLERMVQQFLSRYWLLLGPFLILTYTPNVFTVYNGNVEPTVVFFITAFGAALMSRRWLLAGVLLAFASLVKVLVVFLLVAFLISKTWRVLAGFLLVMIPYGLFLWLAGWLGWEWFFVTDVMANAAFKFRGISDSLHCTLARHFFPAVMNDPSAFKLYCTAINVGFILPYSLGVLLLSRRILRDWLPLGVGFASVCSVMLTPLFEYHHASWALVQLFAIVLLWLGGRVSGMFYLQLPFWLALLAGAYLHDAFQQNGIHGYFIAMLATTGLWLVSGGQLLWLRYRADSVAHPSPRCHTA